MLEYTRHFEAAMAEQADADRRAQMEAYMRDQFPFLGVASQARKAVQTKFWRDVGLPNKEELEGVAIELWSLPQREYHYAAMDLLARAKWWREPNSLVLFESLITKHSWWDTVDFIASTLVGNHLKAFPQKMHSKALEWNADQNLWLIRTSLIFQLKYKDETDQGLLKSCILPHLDSEEFFIQKAIGWALRQLSKYDAHWVRDFVEDHPLKPVSLREAKKYI